MSALESSPRINESLFFSKLGPCFYDRTTWCISTQSIPKSNLTGVRRLNKSEKPLKAVCFVRLVKVFFTPTAASRSPRKKLSQPSKVTRTAISIHVLAIPASMIFRNASSYQKKPKSCCNLNRRGSNFYFFNGSNLAKHADCGFTSIIWFL